MRTASSPGRSCPAHAPTGAPWPQRQRRRAHRHPHRRRYRRLLRRRPRRRPATASSGPGPLPARWHTPFDDTKSKGLTISGKAGDPVYAAADGRVVYAGSGLRGYGNLIIVKHNATYLSAYAHNQTLLVKEDQVVRRGQQIAEMGSSDASQVGLHFEIRRQGKPVDPATLLPPR